MILELIVKGFVALIGNLVNLVETVVNIPVSLISVIGTFTSYGFWILGYHITAIFIGSVVFWFGVKLGYWTVVNIWKLLPFT